MNSPWMGCYTLIHHRKSDVLITISLHLHKQDLQNALEWNPDIMMYQGNGKITSLYWGIALNESPI